MSQTPEATLRVKACLQIDASCWCDHNQDHDGTEASVLFDFRSGSQTHLRAIESKHHSLIHAAIHEQLQFEPETETRNRKPLQRPATMGATYELRFGPDNRFRVFYSVELEVREVRILAIGVKERNKLVIAGEEVEL